MGFRENLKAELAYSGMLVKELSVLSGVNLRALNNYMSSKAQLPSIETGVKIARALGVSAEFLVFGKETVREESRVNEEIRAITRIAKQLDGKRRRFALEMMKLLAESADIKL